MEKYKDMKDLKHSLIDAAKMEMAKGIDNVNAEELGEVVDMIKDLAEACYYCSIVDAMESESYGYDRWRYASGRFAPKGRGTYGYTPERMMPESMGYEPKMMDTPETRNMSTRNMRNIRYGYHKDDFDDTMNAMGDIWAEADEELKNRMKKSVKDLLYQMEQTA